MPLKVLRDNNYLLLRSLPICFMEMGFPHPLLACVWLCACALLLPPSTPTAGRGEGLRHSWLALVSQGTGRDYSSKSPKHLGNTRKSQPRHVEPSGSSRRCSHRDQDCMQELYHSQVPLCCGQLLPAVTLTPGPLLLLGQNSSDLPA